MKKSAEIKVGDKTHELCYDIRSLAKLEKLIGKSITFLFAAGAVNLVRQSDIAFTVAALICGLKLKNEDEAYDLIDAYCKAGNDLDHLNAAIIEAVIATGLFTMGTVEEMKAAPAMKK